MLLYQNPVSPGKDRGGGALAKWGKILLPGPRPPCLVFHPIPRITHLTQEPVLAVLGTCAPFSERKTEQSCQAAWANIPELPCPFFQRDGPQSHSSLSLTHINTHAQLDLNLYSHIYTLGTHVLSTCSSRGKPRKHIALHS